MTLAVCETAHVATYVPSKTLLAAVAAERATKAAHEAAVEQLHEAIAMEVALPTKPADVARIVGYHPGHVRRLARDRGVEPMVDREPPRRVVRDYHDAPDLPE